MTKNIPEKPLRKRKLIENVLRIESTDVWAYWSFRHTSLQLLATIRPQVEIPRLSTFSLNLQGAFVNCAETSGKSTPPKWGALLLLLAWYCRPSATYFFAFSEELSKAPQII